MESPQSKLFACEYKSCLKDASEWPSAHLLSFRILKLTLRYRSCLKRKEWVLRWHMASIPDSVSAASRKMYFASQSIFQHRKQVKSWPPLKQSRIINYHKIGEVTRKGFFPGDERVGMSIVKAFLGVDSFVLSSAWSCRQNVLAKPPWPRWHFLV